MDNQYKKSENSAIDLIELAKQLWIKKWYIFRIALVTAALGLLIGFSIPREYTSTVKMAPEETRTDITGNMSGLAAMAGIKLGMENSEVLSQALYPDIVKSVPFLAELLKIQVHTEKLKTGGSLYNYIDDELKTTWWRAVLVFPYKVIEKISQGKNSATGQNMNPFNLTRKQEDVLAVLSDRITMRIDEETGIITAGVELQDPVLAAVIADSLVTKLERFVIDYRTNKAKQDLDFALKIFEDSKQKYFETQKNYARYIDYNKNIVLESVLIEQQKLQNEMDLAYSIYSDLARQVETARMKVQEQTPVISIIEPARVPARKSNTSKLTIIILFGILGCMAGAVKVFYSGQDKIMTIK
jgi:LPS O-antigen subunit length determinant protein (WzzB/FepE family)